MSNEDRRRRVVIIGGGFAGLFAARALRRAAVQVTLIDRAAHHLFQPLLYQCATGILSEGRSPPRCAQCCASTRTWSSSLAEVTGIDAGRRRCSWRRARAGTTGFGYDYLIVAAGVQQSYFGHDEFARYAPGMKTIEDALVIRRRVFGAFEMAESATDPDGAPPLAHLRPGRRRADGRRTGRADPRGGHQDAALRVPADQARGGTGPAVRRRQRALAPFGPSCPPKLPAPWTSWGSSSTCTRSSLRSTAPG